MFITLLFYCTLSTFDFVLSDAHWQLWTGDNAGILPFRGSEFAPIL